MWWTALLCKQYWLSRLHGWAEGGELHKIRLYDGDMITKVTGRRGLGPGALVDQLTFHTGQFFLE